MELKLILVLKFWIVCLVIVPTTTTTKDWHSLCCVLQETVDLAKPALHLAATLNRLCNHAMFDNINKFFSPDSKEYTLRRGE
jgi:hypothetical protein